MKQFIKNEMMVHIPLCSHKDPKNILIISNDASKYEAEIAKHTKIDSKSISLSLDEISKLEDASFDVVISEIDGDALVTSQINRVLNEDGLLVSTHAPLDDVDSNKAFMSTLGNYFKIIMPYNLGDGSTALLSSKEYHPTADINLHRADMLDNLDFYNCDVHPAAFAMGNNIRRAYLGSIRN